MSFHIFTHSITLHIINKAPGHNITGRCDWKTGGRHKPATHFKLEQVLTPTNVGRASA